ncbi:adenylate kinase, chloroplastic [Ipomoea triloba]|uniref:adenylate kinase, chloroplastic n=1 Tax=Ipomoea triloba TaxID=35885 RepID=UPI00125D6738|nr:adenylate kinase, chloroplastic [Ipomoea triloba]
MAACGCSLPCFKSSPAKSISSFSSPPSHPLHLRLTSVPSLPKSSSLHLDQTLPRPRHSRPPQAYTPGFVVVASANKAEPLRIMISGAPASGKGTQCELIAKKYDLVHISAGDLLRAEISAGTENGKRAKEYMEKGQLVPDEVVVMMVKDRLMQPDSQEKGWLLDGYPRSLSQATALKEYGFQPDLFILLEVHEEKLVERVIGRRLDPVTGKIYHLKYSPPETDEISARLTQRFDDTEEKVKLRLQTHNQNVDSVLAIYEDITFKVDGSVSKVEVFALIDDALAKVLEQKQSKLGHVAA